MSGIILAVSNNIFSRSKITNGGKSTILTKLSNLSATKFFNRLRDFYNLKIDNNFGVKDIKNSSGLDDKTKEHLIDIATLLDNRGYNVSCTKSMALLIVAKALEINQILIKNGLSETEDIDRGRINDILTLFTNFDSSTLDSINSYIEQMELSSEANVQKLKFKKGNYEIKLFNNLTNEDDEICYKAFSFIYNKNARSGFNLDSIKFDSVTPINNGNAWCKTIAMENVDTKITYWSDSKNFFVGTLNNKGEIQDGILFKPKENKYYLYKNGTCGTSGVTYTIIEGKQCFPPSEKIPSNDNYEPSLTTYIFASVNSIKLDKLNFLRESVIANKNVKNIFMSNSKGLTDIVNILKLNDSIGLIVNGDSKNQKALKSLPTDRTKSVELHKKEMLANNQKNTFNANFILERLSSLPASANNVLTNDSDNSIPINQYIVKVKNHKNIETIIGYRSGALFHTKGDINIARATTLINNIISKECKGQDNWVIDLRLLDGGWIGGEQDKFKKHADAISKYETANPNTKVLCIHVPTTQGVSVRSKSITNDGQNQHTEKIDNLSTFLDNKINNIVEETKKQYLYIIKNKFIGLLKDTALNAAKGLLMDTLASILMENISNFYVNVGCKSAKDRASAEISAMIGLRKVITKKIARLLKKEGTVINNLGSYLGSLIKENTINFMSLEDRRVFLKYYDPTVLYLLNKENLGILTNINTREMDNVLQQIDYHRNISNRYKGPSVSS